MENYIKDYREKELKSFLIANVLLIMINVGFLDPIIVKSVEYGILSAVNSILTSALFSSVFYVFVFYLDSLVPGIIKQKLIWCFTVLPGEKIFSDICKKNKDERFTKEQAESLYADIYKKIKGQKESKKIQNSEWYRIYKKHEANSQLITSHRDYLVCRDSCIMMPFIVLGYLCLIVYLHHYISWLMIAIFVVEFVLLLFISRSKGKRFVYNAIAIDIAFSENKKSEKNDS